MSVVRQPFAPLDSPRLLQLSSSKNRQNGVFTTSFNASLGKSKSHVKPAPSRSTATMHMNPAIKRRMTPLDTHEDFDGENTDPYIYLSPTKLRKNNDSTPSKPLASFDLINKPRDTSTAPASKPAPAFSIPTLSAIPKYLQTTPVIKRSKANVSSPRAPLTAPPAGRVTLSPKSRMASNRARRTSAPFTRIDPPFSTRTYSASSVLPFSLDAAIAGSVSIQSTPTASKGKTVQESMPQSWFFDIHEDTPEEEAENLMEHSTLTLDLSSDDESTKAQRADRGKENVPPEDYESLVGVSTTRSGVAFSSSGPVSRSKSVRRKVVKSDSMDDGERSPLSDLETEDFFAEGLDKDSFVLVPGTQETEPVDHEEAEPCVVESSETPVEIADTQDLDVTGMPVVNGEGDIEGAILIWEDADVDVAAGEKRKRECSVKADDNVADAENVA